MDYQESIGRLIGSTHFLFLRTLDRELKQANVPITAEQFKMMTILWQQDGLSQQEIAVRIGRNRSATGRMIDVLEKYEIIERHDHPNDRRLNLIFLSRKGKSLQKQANRCAQNSLDAGLKDFKESEVLDLRNKLKKIIQNLN